MLKLARASTTPPRPETESPVRTPYQEGCSPVVSTVAMVARCPGAASWLLRCDRRAAFVAVLVGGGQPALGFPAFKQDRGVSTDRHRSIFVVEHHLHGRSRSGR